MAGFPNLDDHNMLKSYITAADHLHYQHMAEGMVACNITHSNLTSNHLDIRFDLHWTIAEVKEKLRKHFGTPVEHQRLFHRVDGRVLCEMSDNSKMLGFFSVESGHEIHVQDTDPFSLSRGGGLTDVTLVEKYRMDEETYDKRSGTIREWIKNKRKEDPNYKMKAKGMQQGLGNYEKKEPEPIPGPESVEGIAVDSRCQVMPGKRRGVVKFVGTVPELKDGPWVGVQFDEPVGINNGSLKGTVYFECEEGFGSFVRGKNVTTGDFPEKDLMDSDEEDEGEDENAVPAEEDDDEEI
jgi:tubulin-specific chaperone B